MTASVPLLGTSWLHNNSTVAACHNIVMPCPHDVLSTVMLGLDEHLGIFSQAIQEQHQSWSRVSAVS